MTPTKEMVEAGARAIETLIGKSRSLSSDAVAECAITAALSAMPVPEPSAYEHIMTYETGETNTRLSLEPDSPFGIPGRDYSEEYPVECVPLYRQTVPEASVDTIRHLRNALGLALVRAEELGTGGLAKFLRGAISDQARKEGCP